MTLDHATLHAERDGAVSRIRDAVTAVIDKLHRINGEIYQTRLAAPIADLDEIMSDIDGLIQAAVTPLSDPVAYLVDCGSDQPCLWHARRQRDAARAAAEFGLPLVPLYAASRTAATDLQRIGSVPRMGPRPDAGTDGENLENLKQQRDDARVDRDAMLRAAGFRTGGLDRGGHRETILREIGRLGPYQNQARTAQAALAVALTEVEWLKVNAEKAVEARALQAEVTRIGSRGEGAAPREAGASQSGSWSSPIWRHVKNDTIYVEVGRRVTGSSLEQGRHLHWQGEWAELSSAVAEGELVVFYRSNINNKLWCSSAREFEDGRFVRVDMPRKPDASGGGIGAFCPQSTVSDHLNYLAAFVDGSSYPAEVKADAEKTIAALRGATPRDGGRVPADLRALSERASPLRVFSELDDRGRLFVIRGTAPHYTGNGEIIARNLSSENAKFFAAAVNYVGARIAAEDRGRLATEHGEG